MSVKVMLSICFLFLCISSAFAQGFRPMGGIMGPDHVRQGTSWRNDYSTSGGGSRVSSDDDERVIKKSLQEIINDIPIPESLTPNGKKIWREIRDEDEEKVLNETEEAFSDDDLQSRAITFLRSIISENKKGYHVDELKEYITVVDLESYSAFVSKSPTKDKNRDIYEVCRKKFEDNQEENPEDLEKQLHEKFRLYEDREFVTVKDVRNREYKGRYLKELTTDTYVRIDTYTLKIFDLTMESRARFWQKDHDDFVKKKLRLITKNKAFMTEQSIKDSLMGKIQYMYLEAGYVPDMTASVSNRFSIYPKYWLTREELANKVAKKIKWYHLAKQMSILGYIYMDIGEGAEFVPQNVATAFYNYDRAKERAKSQWENGGK